MGLFVTPRQLIRPFFKSNFERGTEPVARVAETRSEKGGSPCAVASVCDGQPDELPGHHC